MELQSSISYQYNVSRIGSVQRVLVDSADNDVYVARSMAESPEVDGEVLIGADSLPQIYKSKNIIGTFVDVQIQNADEYDLSAIFV